MDETTGMNNPIFRIATNMQQSGMNQMNNNLNQINPNSMQQGGMNQMGMGMGQMNPNMGNQFDPNMMNQNSNFMNNPMMNQNMSMDQGNMMNNNPLLNQYPNNQGNMNQMNMNLANMMNQMNMNQGNMGNGQMDMNQMMNMFQGNNNQDMPLNQQANIMNNNLSNLNIPQNNDVQSNQNYGFINIKFRAGAGENENRAIEIQCTLDEKVSDLIQRYRNKTGDHDPTKKFIFNAKALNHDLTLAEAGLTNNAYIFVVATKGIKGAY